MKKVLMTLVPLALMGLAQAAPAEPMPANYDEVKASAYTLPDPLVFESGAKVATPDDWKKRRAELLELFRTHVYGRPPVEPPAPVASDLEPESPALDGKAIKRSVRLTFGEGERAAKLDFTVYLPAGKPEKVPVFVGVHVFDRAAAHPQPGKPFEAPEGFKLPAGLPPLPGDKLAELIIERGYGFASMDIKDYAPDDKADYERGMIGLARPAGQAGRKPGHWGSLGAWAYGLSRVYDWLAKDARVDAKKVILIGHSRMGKTALWAAAQDERFAMAISNESGCGGAALSKRVYGETPALINKGFPHWFCEKFRDYNDNEAALPVDQHELIALSAPRPVYVGSAAEDKWADPKGEFLAAKAAGAVWGLFGMKGISEPEKPANNVSVGEKVGYHVRDGAHALTDLDWLFYLNFADRWLKGEIID